jgi:hypothetical protein
MITLRAKLGGLCGLQNAQVLLERETQLKKKEIRLSKGAANAKSQVGERNRK